MSKKIINEKNRDEILIYKTSNKEVGLKVYFKDEAVWLSQSQIVELYGKDQSVISRHIRNIFSDEEVDKKSNMQKMHIANSDKPVAFYSLDVILSVGYRTNSKKAIDFRKWANKILKQYIIDGYAINRDQISRNYENFLKAVSDVKALLPKGNEVKAEDVLELINAFAGTWFSLDAYDNDEFPKKGATKKQATFTADDLNQALLELKKDLISKKQATELFGQEKNKGAVAGIVGNVLQSFGGQDVYSTAEEKAAHLLYFMVKNHPLTDGNKRSGAFAFVWFLRRTGILRASLTPEALTALTLLIAESNPKDKDRMTGVVLLMLKKK